MWLIIPEATLPAVSLTLLAAINVLTGAVNSRVLRAAPTRRGYQHLLLHAGVGEAIGEPYGGNLGWGKFVDSHAYLWDSRFGWTVAIAPAAGVSALLLTVLQRMLGAEAAQGARGPLAGVFAGVWEHRPILLAVLLALHFFKRLFEVRFVHRYHNGMEAWVALTLGASNVAACCQFLYFSWTVTAERYAQEPLLPTPVLMRPIKGVPAELPRSVVYGLVMWAVGEAGSHIHHHLLARLRADGSGAYAPPVGGLFSGPFGVWCPHYLFEILAWWGLAAVAQHLQPVVVAAAVTSFLVGRAWATRRWYAGKMGAAFPRARAAIVPMLL